MKAFSTPFFFFWNNVRCGLTMPPGRKGDLYYKLCILTLVFNDNCFECSKNKQKKKEH